jgi:hypothetical protein
VEGILGVAKRDPFEELAQIGDLELPRKGRIIRVRVLPDAEHGPGVDLREFILPSYWDRVNNARARAVAKGRASKGPIHPQQYVGPMKKGWRLAPFKAEELAELLALAVVKAEALAIAQE